MRIPPYWVRESYTGHDPQGREHSFVAWGWSFENREAAQAEARARARRVFDFMIQGAKPERYPYLENPLREEIVRSVKQGNQEIGIVTRNRYGALVLNAASVLFADIDYPPAPKPAGLLQRLFGGGQQMDVQTATIQAVKTWAVNNRGRTFRLYRTRAGLRLLFTDQLYQPTASETAGLLVALGCDPMYRRLTQKQESFRARLTPKPWRCNCPTPPNQYPWTDAAAEAAYRQWEQRYTQITAGYKTCELVEEIGKGAGLEAVEMIVDLHDKYTCDSSGRELA